MRVIMFTLFYPIETGKLFIFACVHYEFKHNYIVKSNPLIQSILSSIT